MIKLILLLLTLPMAPEAFSATLADYTVGCTAANPCVTTYTAVPAGSWYIDPTGGTDSGNCTVVTAPCQTEAKVESLGATSTDVYIKAGTTLNVGILNWPTSGTSGDKTVLGTYYVHNNTGYIWHAEDEGPLNVGRAKINTTTNNTDIFSVGAHDYVTIQDIEFTRSGGVTTAGTFLSDLHVADGASDHIEIYRTVHLGAGSYAAAQTAYAANKRQDCISLDGGDDIIVDGVTCKWMSHIGMYNGNDSRNNTIRNTTIQEVALTSLYIEPGSGPMSLYLYNNVFDTTYLQDLIQGGCGTACVTLQGVYIKGNVLKNGMESAIELGGGKYLVIEENYIYGNHGDTDGGTGDRTGGSAIDVNTTYDTEDVIIRRNIIYDSKGGINCRKTWHCYNNTVIGNNRDYTGTNSTFTDSTYKAPFFGIRSVATGAKQVINNIMQDENSGNAEVVLGIGSTAVRINGNMYYRTSSTAKFSYEDIATAPWTQNAFAAWKTILQGNGTITEDDASSLEANPTYINMATADPTGTHTAYNFNLASSSTAINAGVPHTLANGAGTTSTALIVDDACMFSDGWNTPIHGDYIKIGTNSVVEITTVNCATNTLTLATFKTWANNDEVWLTDSTGAKFNDMGACEVSIQDWCAGSNPGAPAAPEPNVYYVSASAGAGGTGAIGSPFDTISDCNTILIAGDTCVIQAGSYTGSNNIILPTNSGTAGQYITYDGSSGAYPTLASNTTPIQLDGKNWIKVKGLKVSGQVALSAFGSNHPGNVDRWVDATNATNLRFEGNKFEYASAITNMFCFNIDGTSSDIEVVGNTFYECGTPSNNGANVDRGILFFTDINTNRILLENNYMERAGHDVIEMYGNDHIIRKNTVTNNWTNIQTGVGIKVAQFTANASTPSPYGRYLIEQNIFKDTGFDTDASKVPLVVLETVGSIFRNNVVSNSRGTNTYGIFMSACCDDTNISRYQRIYNNLVSNIENSPLQYDTTNTATTAPNIHDNFFKNNAVARSANGSPVAADYTIEVAKRYGGADKWNINKWIGNSLEDSLGVAQVRANGTDAETLTFTGAEASYGATFASNTGGTLGSIDNGIALTTITSASGNGTSFTVADSLYFSDGWGATAGDSIKIGSQACATIASIDKSTNIITMAVGTSWILGNTVNLCYTGTGPDRGVESNVIPGSSLTSGAPSAPPGNTPVVATGYFVDCTNGSDSANGTSVTTPWKTIGKVNSTVTAAGSDVWFLAGTTCRDAFLWVDWSGTATGSGPSTVITNPVIIGGYYVSAGVGYQNIPDNWTASLNPQDGFVYTRPRPIIEGTYHDSCRVTRSCPYTPEANNALAIPFNEYYGLVTVETQYVVVQDLYLKDSAGEGVRVNPVAFGSGHGTAYSICLVTDTVCSAHVTIQRNKMERLISGGIITAYSNFIILRQNEVSLDSLAWGDNLPGVTGVGSPVGVFNGSLALVENNWVHDGYGDGFGMYSAYVLLRGNRMASQLRASVYLSGWNDEVSEQNIVVSGLQVDTVTVPGKRGPSNSFWVSASSQEVLTSPADRWGDTRVVHRNNLLQAADTCVSNYVDSSFQGTSATNLFRMGHKWIGNTCISPDATKLILDFDFLPAGSVFLDQTYGQEVTNNLFVTANAGSCTSDVTSGLITFHHNQWTTTPSVSNCKSPGTGDVYSSNTGMGTFNFALSDTAHFPLWSDFAISLSGAGATAASAADYNSSGFIDSGTTWDWVLAQRQWLPSCNTTGVQVPKSEWVKDGNTDYCGNSRTTTIGGLNASNAGITGYFIDCANGDNALAGTSPGTAWRTVQKVNQTTLATSSDVWFKSGTTCTDAALYIDWAGTAVDRAVIGSYYVSGGTAYQVMPDQEPTITPPRNMTFANPRAIIQGSYRPSCRAWPSKCAFDTGGAIPSGKYSAMIFNPGYAYVTIQSLDVRDSAAGGITVDGFETSGHYPCAGQAACNDYSIVQYNRVDHSAYMGIYLQASAYNIVRGNLITYTGLNRVDSQTGGIDGGGTYISHCDPCHTIYENNLVSDVWNEGIGMGNEAFVLWRGNIVTNTLGFYGDGSSDLIIEQNIVANGNYRWETGLGNPANETNPTTNRSFCSLCLTKEGSTTIGSTAQSNRRQIFRNNVAANQENCMFMSIDYTAGLTYPGSGGFWGNTCIGSTGKGGVYNDATNAVIDTPGVDFQNNIFATTTGAPNCDATNAQFAKVTLTHNWWAGTPAANCRNPGTGDVYSTFAALGVQGGFQHFTDADYNNLPLAADFAVGPTSSAATGGGTLTATYLTIANWQWEYDNMAWRPACSLAKPSAASWAQQNSIDYCDSTRTGAIGALNAGTSQLYWTYQNNFDLAVPPTYPDPWFVNSNTDEAGHPTNHYVTNPTDPQSRVWNPEVLANEGTTHYRNEVVLNSSVLGATPNLTLGQDYWIGFKIWLPSTHWAAAHTTSGDYSFHVSQIHGDATVPFTMSVYDRRSALGITTPFFGVLAANTHTVLADPLPLNQWINVVVNIKLSSTTTGYTRIWVNGVEKLNTTAANVSGADANFYWKSGMYAWPFDTIAASSLNYTLTSHYMAKFRASRNASFDAVDPSK